MDGATVKLNDIVYDIILGSGVVTTVDATLGFKVSFGPGRVLHYSNNGEFAGVKRLYWANPVFYVPPKNDPHRATITRVIEAIRVV